MSRDAVTSLPNRLKIAVFVVFSLLAMAVVASENRLQHAPRHAPVLPSAPLAQDSLLLSHIGDIGARIAGSWRR